MESDLSWMSIVDRYLQACYDESKLQRDAGLTSSLANLFRENGSTSLAESYFAKFENLRDSLRAPADSSEWIMVANSDRSVMVEIPVDMEGGLLSTQVPFFRTRLLLSKREDGEWQIDDLLHPCMSCNTENRHRKTIAGKCTMCQGAGHLQFMKEKACNICSGTGKCQSCKNGSFEGWRRAGFLCESPRNA